MPARSFRIAEPSSIQDFLDYVKRTGAKSKPLAGGTDLLHMLKQRALGKRAEATQLVDLNYLPELKHMKMTEEGFAIGAMTSLSELEESSVVKDLYPILGTALSTLATPLIRNMATVGGNICQDFWCWYYRAEGNAFDCLRKGGKTCPAISQGEGEHEWNYSIFGGIDGCVAVSPSDLAGPLAVLGAQIVLMTDAGVKQLPVIEFIKDFVVRKIDAPWLLTGLLVPRPRPNSTSAFTRFSFRRAIDFAVVSASVQLCFDKQTCIKARLVLGGVYPTPQRCARAERLLEGNVISEDMVQNAAEASLEEASPLPKNSHKLQISRGVLKRAIFEALKGR